VIAYLSLQQVLAIHAFQIERYGGADGIRDRGGVEAAVARPTMTFGGEDLYPELADKAAALMHSIVMSRPFVDGNKRAGAHAALLFLVANGFEPAFGPSELTAVTLAVARGEVEAQALSIWFKQRIRQRQF